MKKANILHINRDVAQPQLKLFGFSTTCLYESYILFLHIKFSRFQAKRLQSRGTYISEHT